MGRVLYGCMYRHPSPIHRPLNHKGPSLHCKGLNRFFGVGGGGAYGCLP